MKRFSCGDVVPGCTAGWTERDEATLFAAIAVHARYAHGIAEIPDDLLTQVRARIVSVG